MSNHELINDYERKIKSALKHFEYSLRKVRSLPVKNLDEEQLETWESYTSRLARVVDLFLTKYIKAIVKIEDPAFDGTLRDYCNLAEKMGMIDTADSWLALRELRNTHAHEYEEDDLAGFFDGCRREADRVLTVHKALEKTT